MCIRDSCKDLRRFISEEFVLKSCYSGAAYQYSYGVSVYFPWATVLAKYENLDFVTEPPGRRWLSFLLAYTQLTRREPRGFAAYKQRMSSDQMASDRMASDRMASD